MRNTNKKGASIIFAILMVSLFMLMAYSILSYIMPFAKNTKGIEFSTSAYYNAYSGLEEAIYLAKVIENNNAYSTGNLLPDTILKGSGYEIIGSGAIIPVPGLGTSEYDNDYNKISLGNPIDIKLTSGVDWSYVDIIFRVPDLDNDLDNDETSSYTGSIAWSLVGPNNIINSDPEKYALLSANNNEVQIGGEEGKDLYGSGITLNNFYTGANGCGANYACTLKFYIVDPLFDNTGKAIPYLEYKIDFGGNSQATNYIHILAEGKANAFKRIMNVAIPRNSSQQSFNFTVFQ